jgi:hypothetical protein
MDKSEVLQGRVYTLASALEGALAFSVMQESAFGFIFCTALCGWFFYMGNRVQIRLLEMRIRKALKGK